MTASLPVHIPFSIPDALRFAGAFIVAIAFSYLIVLGTSRRRS